MLMLAPAEVPTEDNSVVPKGVEETGIGVCLQGLMVSLGFSVTGPIKTDELAFQASEVLGALVGGVDIHVIVFCGLSGLTTLMQKPPRRRRRGKAISRATGGSRSWDLNVGKLQKNTQGLGRETWSAPLLLPTSLPTAKPNLWFNVLGFFFFSILAFTITRDNRGTYGSGDSHPEQPCPPGLHSLFQPVALDPLFPSPYSSFQTIGTFLHPLSIPHHRNPPRSYPLTSLTVRAQGQGEYLQFFLRLGQDWGRLSPRGKGSGSWLHPLHPCILPHPFLLP